ncbi:hypothetical protein ACWEF6_02800 [Amycolatopsis sp. NPDC004772]
MTEQPTTSPPAGRTPTLGHGLGRWSAHIDGELLPTEPYQPPPRHRSAAGWPKPGTVGASTCLNDDEEPATVPARPYADARPNRGEQDRVGQLLVTADTEPDERPVWVAYLFGRAIGWFRR